MQIYLLFHTKVTRAKNITIVGIIITTNVLKRNILAVRPQEIGISPKISCWGRKAKDSRT